jgi:hypothetical protein
MRRPWLLLLGVVLFFVVAIVAVILLDGATREPPPGATMAAPPEAAPVVARPPDVAPAPVDAPGPPSPAPQKPVALGRPLVATPLVGEWERIPATPVESWPTLSQAIEKARPTLAPCYDPDVQAQYGGRPYSAVGAPRPGAGVPVVLVQVETFAEGRARVVDAPVESRGSAEDGLLACIQERLRGLEVQGRGAAGSRFRIRYALSPMIQGLPQKPFLRPPGRVKRP